MKGSVRKIFSFNPGKCRIVFLEEIPVAGLTNSDTESLKEKTFKIMESKLLEYNARWIMPSNGSRES